MTGFAALPIAEDGGEQHEDDSRLTGVSRILGPRWLQLPTLTVGLLGVQVLWSVEMSYGTPYLISLGLSKSAVSMVFLAGPISGLVVQPLIGVLADNSKSRFGRRRPYMLLGVLICTGAMLLLGFTRPFTSVFTTWGSAANNLLTIWLAIFALFSIDFSINAVQAVDRALLVDTLPTSQQPDGNAWAARMLGIGSVAGYFVGNIDMTRILPFLGKTELEVLSVVGSFLLVLTHGVTAYCTKEKVVVASKRDEKGLKDELKEIWTNARTLPPVIRQICIIQFFAWMGWFPVLFNTTEFISEIYKKSVGATESSPDIDEILAEGARIGSRALFYSAVLSLAANILLPFFVSESGSRKRLQNVIALGVSKPWWVTLYEKMKVHLAMLWAVSHLVFAICMGATFFYSGVFGATFFTTLTGFSWSITQWAPFALLAEAILADDDSEDAHSILLDDTRSPSRQIGGDAGDEHERQFLVGSADDDDPLADEVRSFTSSASMDGDEDAHEHERSNSLMNNASARMSHLDVHTGHISSENDPLQGHPTPRRPRGGSLAAKAGVILGIQNIFVVIPQFIMTGIASIIFAIVEPGRPASGGEGEPSGNSTMPSGDLRPREGSLGQASGPGSYAIIFRLGGVAAFVAFILTIKLTRQLRH